MREAWLAAGVRPLVLRPVSHDEEYVLTPSADGGGFSEEDLERARQALTPPHVKRERDVHPRLLEVLYRAVLHFEAPYVTVVSGIRGGRRTSRHSHGRAMDVVLPGITDEDVAEFFKKQGFVGVGLYPVSGFVHLDVRAEGFFWIDRSGPGQRSRRHGGIRLDEADQAARARGESPVAPLRGRSRKSRNGRTRGASPG